ncbi:MAG: hypothetical protein AB7P49_00030 [Bdellovibrionales bacterium]
MPKRRRGNNNDDDDNQPDSSGSVWSSKVLRRRRREDTAEEADQILMTRIDEMFQSEDSENSDFCNSQFSDDSDEDDDDGESSKKSKRKGKKNKKEPKECSFVLSDTPTGRNERRPFSLIDVTAEAHMQGDDPVEAAALSAIQGNEAPTDQFQDLSTLDFIETAIGSASSSSDDEADDECEADRAAVPPEEPEQSVEQLCEEYTETLRTARMPESMASEFTSWRCWYCRHREDMRQIPPDKRSTVMQSFGIAMDDYETATLETQAAILYQLWASVFLRASIDGSRPEMAPEDVMTVERFFICLRDHIPPTERPMTAVAEVSRQLMLLLELTQQFWERRQVVLNPDGSTRISTYLDYKAIAAHLAAAKQLTALMGTPQGKFRRTTANTKPVTKEEASAVYASLRMCPVQRPPSRRTR